MAQDGRSAVVAIVGPWGSGKTSLLELVKERLRSTDSMRTAQFNPWLVGSVESLVQDFFSALLAAIDSNGRRNRRTREVIAKYGGATAPLMSLIPIAGTPLAAAGQFASNLVNNRSLDHLRRDAEAELANLKRPIVVMVDDIDRLQGDELLLLFKLIRLVGRLPNVHYLVAFDDETVTDVLTAESLASGKHDRALTFLEKIVQVRVDIPPLHATDIDRMVNESCDRAFCTVTGLSTADRERFTSVYERHLRPHLTQPRQIKRLFAQIQATLPLVAGEVNAVDFIIVTFIRVAYPALYGGLAQHGDDLTSSLSTAFKVRNVSQEERLSQWESFVKASRIEDPQPVLKLLAELFPAVADAVSGTRVGDAVLSAERRIGAPEYFDRYFQLGIPPDDVPDTRIAMAVNAIAEGESGSPDIAWLEDATGKHGSLVLAKMYAAWVPIGADAAARMVRFLSGIYGGLFDHHGELVGPGRRVEAWLGEIIAKSPAADVGLLLDAALTPSHGLRLLCRALSHASYDESLKSMAGFALAAGMVTDLVREAMGNAVQYPVHENEDVVWMLRDATRFGDSEDIRTWIREALDYSSWTTREFVGCFTPLARFVGVAGEPFLSEFAVAELVHLIPLQEVFRRLERDLDEFEQPLRGLSPLSARDRDTSFAHRVECALASLKGLRATGPVDSEPPVLSIDELHPLRWAPGQGAELVIRSAVALPRTVVTSSMSSDAAVLPIEQQEELLVAALESSEITRWLHEQGGIWRWSDRPRWLATAFGGDSLTECVFEPSFPGEGTPFSARCVLQLANCAPADRSDPDPVVQLVLDLSFNILELDHERRTSSVRHSTTPTPAPGALSLAELADALRVSLKLPEVAKVVCARLPVSPAKSGEVGTWVALRGVAIDRVVDLARLERRRGGTEVAEWSGRSRYPLPASVWGIPPEVAFVTRFLQRVLESSGYRNLGPTIDGLRQCNPGRGRGGDLSMESSV